LKLAEFAKIPIAIGNHAFCSLERFEREDVSWGFHKPKTLAKGGPFRTVYQPQDIPSAISAHFLRGGSGD